MIGTKVAAAIGQRWHQLPPRDQLALAALLVAVGAWLIYTLGWQPLHQANQNLRSANAGAAASLLQVRALAEQYRKLQELDGTAQSGPAAPLSQLIDESLAAHQLQMTRYQPGSGGDAQVRLDAVPFAQVLRWLHALEEEHGVAIQELSIAPAGSAGSVSVSVRLAAAP